MNVWEINLKMDAQMIFIDSVIGLKSGKSRGLVAKSVIQKKSAIAWSWINQA